MSPSDARTAPFAFGEAEARAAALAWVHRRWLASPALSRCAREGPIESVWVPFWLIDAHAVAHWEGPGLRGIIEMDFGGLSICAEALADAALMEALEPWPARAFRPHNAQDLADRTVVRATLSRDDAIALAGKRMERELLAAARRGQAAATRERMRLLGVEYPREACEPVLLPLWRFEGHRFGRRWRIAINGSTGKAAGHAAAAS